MATIHFDEKTRLTPEHPWSDRVDVTLMWAHHGDAHHVRVCVCDRREGAYFELEYEDDRLAA